jgi:hypothetical protein
MFLIENHQKKGKILCLQAYSYTAVRVWNKIFQQRPVTFPEAKGKYVYYERERNNQNVNVDKRMYK